MFDRANLLLQRKDPVIHILHDILSNLYREILLSFLTVDYVSSADCLSDVSLDVDSIDYLEGNLVHGYWSVYLQ